MNDTVTLGSHTACMQGRIGCIQSSKKYAELQCCRELTFSIIQSWFRLLTALIVSKVDYCNSALAGVSRQQQDRLQSVLNSAARLVYTARRLIVDCNSIAW